MLRVGVVRRGLGLAPRAVALVRRLLPTVPGGERRPRAAPVTPTARWTKWAAGVQRRSGAPRDGRALPGGRDLALRVDRQHPAHRRARDDRRRRSWRARRPSTTSGGASRAAARSPAPRFRGDAILKRNSSAQFCRARPPTAARRDVAAHVHRSASTAARRMQILRLAASAWRSARTEVAVQYIELRFVERSQPSTLTSAAPAPHTRRRRRASPRAPARTARAHAGCAPREGRGDGLRRATPWSCATASRRRSTRLDEASHDLIGA